MTSAAAARVLVTGAGGFLGRATVESFESAGWEAAAAVRSGPVPAGGLRLDFGDPAWRLAFDSLPTCRAIVHLADVVDLSPDADPARFRSTAIEGTSGLAEIARAWGAFLVVASSVSVYGAVERADASTRLDPQTPYARAKVAAEEAAARGGAPWAALRFHGLFGASGPAHLGINRTIDAVLSGGPAVIAGDGLGRRNYSYVRDAADAVRACVERSAEGVHCVSGREALSIREMAEAVASVLGDGRVERRAGAAGRDFLVVPSAALPPGRSFREALADARARAGRSAAC